MPTVENTTDKEVCVRTGKDHTEYIFYFVPPHGSIEVSIKKARAIAKRVKQTKTEGLTVSRFLKNPLKKPEPEKIEEETPIEIN